MITDAMLRLAAAEAEHCLLGQLPEPQDHTFTPAFERKIQKLITRAKHPVRHQVLKYVAAVLLAIITLFGAVFAASPEVRASVVGWFKSSFLEYFQYSSDSTVPSAPKADYRLTEIPEGYTLVNVIDKVHGKTYLYEDASGFYLRFSYDYGGNVFIQVDGYQQQTASVHGKPADIYIAPNADETSMIVWQDTETGALFRLSIKADAQELIRLAESVQKVEP